MYDTIYIYTSSTVSTEWFEVFFSCQCINWQLLEYCYIGIVQEDCASMQTTEEFEVKDFSVKGLKDCEYLIVIIY